MATDHHIEIGQHRPCDRTKKLVDLNHPQLTSHNAPQVRAGWKYTTATTARKVAGPMTDIMGKINSIRNASQYATAALRTFLVIGQVNLDRTYANNFAIKAKDGTPHDAVEI